MAEPTETTSLLDIKADYSYENNGYGSNTSPLPEDPDDCSVSVDDLLDRIKYSFLEQKYDIETDAYNVIQKCSQQDTEKLLATLSTTPLCIRQKLNIHKQIRSGGKLRHGTGYSKGREVTTKRKTAKLGETYHIWDSTIAKLAAYFGSNVASYFRFARTVVYINILMAVPLVAFIVLPEIVEGNFQTNVTFGGHFGEMSNSFIFYGLYQENLSYEYNLPLAYILTWLVTNLLALVFIIMVMTLRYRRSKLSEEKGSEYTFAWRMFCIWDYSITSREGVMDHRISFRTDIKEMIREEKAADKRDTKYTLLKRYIGRVFINLIVLGLLVGSGFLIYKVATTDNILPDSAAESLKDFVQKYKLTAVVAGLKFLVPSLFQQLVLLEGWHPRMETKITLARTTVFYIASLMVFVASLYDVADTRNCRDFNVSLIPHDTACCWENEVGEEVFKVILVDLGLIIAVGSCVHLSRALLMKCCCQSIGYSTFDIVSCVLDVVYGQGLIWLGVYFSPLLPVLAVIKLVILFYFRYFVARVAMVPPKQLFRASSTGNFYLAILLLYLFISLFPMAYAVIEFKSSVECGPFQNYERPWHVVTELIGELPDWLEDGLDYLGTPAVFVPVLVFMILVAVYFKVKSSSYKRLIVELRRQLKFERKVEKRKIFQTGRNMSGGALGRYTSQESLASNLTTPGARRRRSSLRSADTVSILLEAEEDM